MPDNLQVLLFDIKGEAEIQPEPARKTGDASQTAKGDVKPQSVMKTEEESAESEKIAAELNHKAVSIGHDIERELRRILPPMVTVQATVRFEAGSLLISGIVALLSWAGPIALDAAKEELGKLVKLCVQRVISRSVSSFPSIVGAIEMSVMPQVTTSSRSPARSLGANKPGAVTALFVITGIILILQIMILFDRFFLIHLRP